MFLGGIGRASTSRDSGSMDQKTISRHPKLYNSASVFSCPREHMESTLLDPDSDIKDVNENRGWEKVGHSV